MRYALGLEYDGTGFSGWQRLDRPDAATPRPEPTLQAALEDALSSVAGHRVSTTCAGRTDAGVHAACQVVHF
ncbi:MAG TPA: tRNA pseudouridine(38-40) synthase TruA, partial [Luteimonas sp.]|nr:tRNA pseudouridine(38-40) synthase TruA [Luteimonas sp.]